VRIACCRQVEMILSSQRRQYLVAVRVARPIPTQPLLGLPFRRRRIGRRASERA
jgi:hypothetical protein